MCLFVDDWVYLPDDNERQEYVMNEEGVIYRGTSSYPRPMPWVFGQVSIRVLIGCFELHIMTVLCALHRFTVLVELVLRN